MRSSVPFRKSVVDSGGISDSHLGLLCIYLGLLGYAIVEVPSRLRGRRDVPYAETLFEVRFMAGVRRHRALLNVLTLCVAITARAQTPVDSALLAYINTIRAVDVHAHPMRPVPPGAPADTEFDALPLDGIPPFAVPQRLTLDDPAWRMAQDALYHVPSAAGDSVYRAALRAAVERTRREHGEHFPEWTLDQAGIEIMLANRIAMGTGLPTSRFKWVPFADPLLLPLDTRAEASRTPDTRSLYPKEAALLQRYYRELGIARRPATL